MTLAASSRTVTYSPVSATTVFAVPFPIFAASDIKVEVDGVDTAAFTVTATFSDGRAANAQVTLVTAVSGVDVVIYSARVVARANDYLGSAPRLARNIQNDLDLITAVQQEQARDLLDVADVVADALPLIDAVDEAVASAEAQADAASASAVAAAASAVSAAAAENSLLEWRGPWVTGTAYAPSDIVYQGGSAYACVVAHTAGTFATDLGAGRWQVFAAQGAAGAGTGDMLRASNLSDVASVSAALANLGLSTVAKKDAANTFTQVQTFSAGIARGNPVTVGDLNALTDLDLLYAGSGATGKPDSKSYLVENRRQASGQFIQTAHCVSEPGRYDRRYTGGAWQAWIRQDYGTAVPAHETLIYEALSGASEIELTGFVDDARFIGYDILLTEMAVSSDDCTLFMRFSGDGGATWDQGASDYSWFNSRQGEADLSSAASSSIRLTNTGIGSAPGEGAGFTIHTHSFDRDTRYSLLDWTGVAVGASGHPRRVYGSAAQRLNKITNAVQIYPSGGTITCKVVVIGLRSI